MHLKKKTMLALVLMLVLSHVVCWASAKPYKQGFNVPIDTEPHDFAVAAGWGHLVDSYDDGYIRYTYHADGGVDNTGCLEIGAQTLYNWDTDESFEMQDMLVTPPLTGKMSIEAKITRTWSEKAGLHFYKIEEKNGKLVAGDEITPIEGTVTGNAFSKVTLPALPAGTRVGIRGYYVMIDNLEADEADVTLKRALKVVDAAWAGGKYTDMDANGNFQVAWRVAVQNTGDYTLNPGDEGYALELVRHAVKTHVATVPINKTLDQGATDTVLVSATVSKAMVAGGKFYADVREDISGSSLELPAVEPTPYKALFSLTGAYGRTPLVTGNHIDFGTSRNQVDVKLLLRNDGALKQSIASIVASNGFKVEPQSALTIAPHDSLPLTVSLTTDVTGDKHGTLTVKGDGVDLTLGLNGYTVAKNETLYDFEDGKVPENFVTNRAWFIDNMPTYIYSVNNRSCIYTSHQDTVRLVLPCMEVKAGQQLSLECSKGYTHSFVDVSYSADRLHWTTVRSIQVDEMSDSALARSWGGYYYALKRFVVNNIPAGEWYVSLTAGNSYVDNILTDYRVLGDEHNAYFSDMSVPSQAVVNSPATVKTTLHNVVNRDETAGTYEAAFYIDGEKVATAAPADLKAMGEVSLTATFAPHRAGTLKGCWKYSVEGTVVQSDSITLHVMPETTAQTHLTDSLVHHSYSTSAPMDPYNYNGESEFIYTADELGLAPNTAITALSWYGYNMKADIPVKLKLYLQNTDSTEINKQNGSYKLTPADSLTLVFNAIAQLEPAGAADSYDRILNVTLDKPFVYTGGNLRVQFHGSTDTGARIFWAATKGVADQHRAVARNSVYAQYLENATIYADALPVIGVEYQLPTYSVSGRVADAKGQPVAGARVVLTNGMVSYEAQAGADGTYTMTVYKTNLNYSAVAISKNATSDTLKVAFDGKDVNLDFVVGGTATSISSVAGMYASPLAVFGPDGKRRSQLAKGLNIVRMTDGTVRKVVVR